MLFESSDTWQEDIQGQPCEEAVHERVNLSMTTKEGNRRDSRGNVTIIIKKNTSPNRKYLYLISDSDSFCFNFVQCTYKTHQDGNFIVGILQRRNVYSLL